MLHYCIKSALEVRLHRETRFPGMSANITRQLQGEWISLHRVPAAGLHRRHSAVLQKKWRVKGVEGNRWSQALLEAVRVYVYLCNCTIDVWMVVMGVGCDFCCVKVSLSGVFSYCWWLTLQADVSDMLGDTSGQLGQCVLHCMSRGLVQTCCQSWGALWPCGIWSWMLFC
jgi:hypothetical protein